MDFSDIPGAFVKLFELITASSSSAIFSFVGIVLLFLAGGLAYIAITSKPEELSPLVKTALFISLLGGMLFSAAGPSLALLDVAKNSIKKMKVEEAFKNLENNTEVHYVVRLISFDPNEEPALSIDRLTNLGPPDQLFSFVASYDELVGYTVQEALEKVGQSYRPGKRVSAIIFPLRTSLYPAGARGLLQIVQEVEGRKEIQAKLTQKFFSEDNSLSGAELKDLDRTSIQSYKFTNFSDKYRHYCELAREFNCNKKYSARAYVGGLYDDWHPLGFSIKNPTVDRCSLAPSEYCQFTDWEKARNENLSGFGSRVFLIRNLEVKNIPGRIMIDFLASDQVIPDIGKR
jgi:hypothetical protein